MMNALVEADGGADDDDDEVVTLHYVCDIQRDLLGAATGGLISLQPVARGVFHRRTGETLSLFTADAAPGVPASRLLMLEYCTPGVHGTAVNIMTTLGVGAGGGALTLLSRVDSVMQPSVPRPTLAFPPADGVTATAGFARAIQGAFGLAYAPCVPGHAVVGAGGVPPAGRGGLPDLLPLVG